MLVEFLALRDLDPARGAAAFALVEVPILQAVIRPRRHSCRPRRGAADKPATIVTQDAMMGASRLDEVKGSTMDSLHDLGGKQGFGRVSYPDQPRNETWEPTVHALSACTLHKSSTTWMRCATPSSE